MERQAVVFVAILAAAFTLIYGGLIVLELSPVILFVLLLAFVGFFSFSPRIMEFKEYERGVLFLFGRFKKIVGPGWVIIIPHVHSVEKVDLRTQVMDIKPQNTITKEQIRLKIDVVVYWRVVDPFKAIVAVKNYEKALMQLLYSEIRNIVGNMSVEDVIANTDEIENQLYAMVKAVEDQWGISTKDVEVQSIELPPRLAEAMQRRRAALDYKIKLETEAEARKMSIQIVNEAASKMSDRTLAYFYLDALKRIADGKANKIIFPLELSRLANILADKSKGGEDYASIAKGLINTYQKQQKEALDAQPEEAEAGNAKPKPFKALKKKKKRRASPKAKPKASGKSKGK